MKDLTLKQHRIRDPIVLASIHGINKVKAETGVDGHITGGMAVNSYLPPELRRSSVDLDFSLYWGGDTEEFRTLTYPLMCELRERGYEAEGFQKRNLSYELVAGSNGDSLLIQHQRRNKKNLEKNALSIQREMANHRTVSKDGFSYDVLSPEDLVLRKMSRMIKFSGTYSIEMPRNVSIPDFTQEIERRKKELAIRSEEYDPRLVTEIRMLCDAYDIKTLADYVGLNDNYFSEASADWVSPDISDSTLRKTLESLSVSLD